MQTRFILLHYFCNGKQLWINCSSRKIKLTLSRMASTIWHWLDISFTIPTTLSSLGCSNVGPNIIARFRTSICQHLTTDRNYRTSLKINISHKCTQHFHTSNLLKFNKNNMQSEIADFAPLCLHLTNWTKHTLRL